MTKRDNPSRRPRRSWRAVVRYLVHQRASPEAIARGMAIGLIITFTPTVGIQIALAIVFATLFNANRISAILPVWLTNVFTVPPTYAFTYWVGSHAFPRKGYTFVSVRNQLSKLILRHDFYRLDLHFRDFYELCKDIFVPMMVGGLVVGTVAAAVGYPLTLRWVRRHRARRSERIRERAHHLSMLRRKPAAEDPGSDATPKDPSPAAAGGKTD